MSRRTHLPPSSGGLRPQSWTHRDFLTPFIKIELRGELRAEGCGRVEGVVGLGLVLGTGWEGSEMD